MAETMSGKEARCSNRVPTRIKSQHPDIQLAYRVLSLWGSGRESKFRFSQWVADEWDQIVSAFGPTAKMYHSGNDDPHEVRSLSVFREPTNIAMDRCNSNRHLDEFYHAMLFDDGQRNRRAALFPDGKFSSDPARHEAIRSYYHGHNNDDGDDGGRAFRSDVEGAYRFTSRNHRMPQIAAYARTPMRYLVDHLLHRNDEGIHVLSLIGSGFDARDQPDYRYFVDPSTRDIREDRQQEFFREKQLGFVMALQCAFDHGLDRIEFVAVGAGAYARLVPRNRIVGFLRRAWSSDEVQNYKQRLEHQMGKQIYFSSRTEPPFSHNNGIGGGIPSFYVGSGWTGEGHGRDWKDAIERTLFINGWDPWSLVGNGNEMDYSVDGHYGRQSALGLLCWPITNPHIQYRRIDF